MLGKICAPEVNAHVVCYAGACLPACLSPCILRCFTWREELKKKTKKRKDERRNGKGEMEIFHLNFQSSIMFVFAEDSNDDLPPLLDRCGID